MGKRQIIRIDQDKCDGCGMCVPSCAEGAIQIVDGKAQLLADRFCDGLGACLGECPQGALTIEDREAEEFVGPAPGAPHPEAPAPAPAPPGEAFVCPGSRMQQFQRGTYEKYEKAPTPGASALGHWPIKLRLVAPQAPFLKGASLLVAADCAPFAAGDFHSRFLEGKALLCGCPKFDDVPETWPNSPPFCRRTISRRLALSIWKCRAVSGWCRSSARPWRPRARACR